MLLASTKIYMLKAPPACLGHLTLGIFILRKSRRKVRGVNVRTAMLTYPMSFILLSTWYWIDGSWVKCIILSHFYY